MFTSKHKAPCLPGWLVHPLASLHMSTFPGRSTQNKGKHCWGYLKRRFSFKVDKWKKRENKHLTSESHLIKAFQFSIEKKKKKTLCSSTPTPNYLMSVWYWQSYLSGHIVTGIFADLITSEEELWINLGSQCQMYWARVGRNTKKYKQRSRCSGIRARWVGPCFHHSKYMLVMTLGNLEYGKITRQ